MGSLHPGYEYDIFISYRQNDNRSGWVTEFVKALEEELSATIKERISIYFDINPHDGLLETHDVNKSLEGKLKCLIFLPILSQTYCDIKSFAWQHEFCAFNKLAKEDQFGRDIKLSSGNVASRILPIKIHDLDAEDKATIEGETGGTVRAIDFIFKSQGVNRPLKSTDARNENLTHAYYQDQINKVANAIKELIHALHNGGADPKQLQGTVQTSKKDSRKTKVIIALLLIVLLGGAVYYFYRGINAPDEREKRIYRIAVLPFKSIGEPGGEYFVAGMKDMLIKYLRNNKRISIPPSLEATDRYLDEKKSHQEIAKELNADFIIEGSVQKAGESIQFTIKLIDPLKDEILYTYDEHTVYSDVINIQKQIAQGISRELGTTLPGNSRALHSTNMEAIDLYFRGKEFTKGIPGIDSTVLAGRESLRKSITLDPQFAEAYYYMAWTYMFSKELWDSVGLLIDKALEIYPTYKDAMALKSQELFFLKGDTAGSIRMAKETLDLDPDDPQNIMLLAWNGYLYEYWLRDGREFLALPYYLKAIDLDRDYPGGEVNAYGSIGLFFVHMGDYIRGEGFLKEAIARQDQTYFFNKKALAYLYLQTGQYEKLTSLVAAIGDSNQFMPSYLWKAVTCLHSGKYDEGIRSIQKPKMKKNKDDTMFSDYYLDMTTYTLLLERTGSKSEAKKIWQEVIEQNLKTKPLDYSILARCYAKLGEKEKALSCFDKVDFNCATPINNPDSYSRDLMLESLWKEPRFINKIQKGHERLKGIRDRIAIMEKEKLIVLPLFARNN